MGFRSVLTEAERWSDREENCLVILGGVSDLVEVKERRNDRIQTQGEEMKERVM